MAIEQRMSVEQTRAVIEPFIEAGHDDVSMMAPDVVFRIMSTGDEYRTPEGVKGMLAYFYHVAFDAKSETKNVVVGEGIAVLEADFVGRHIGEFAGVAPTGKDVRVPLAVIYDLRNDQIVEGRVYFETPAFLAQVGTPG
jgi:predicted ester cyclase